MLFIVLIDFVDFGVVEVCCLILCRVLLVWELVDVCIVWVQVLDYVINVVVVCDFDGLCVDVKKVDDV